MDNFIIGDIVEASGYVNLNNEDVKEWPDFLPKGTHRISNIEDSLFGQLVKTDRCNFWLHYNWFRKV